MRLCPADERALRRACELARLGQGEVEPNPPVGAVLYSGDEVLAEGFHHAYGELHAERDLLRSIAEGRARLASGAPLPSGASLAVTLEPCSTRGKQPPCTEALVEAGLRRVVVGASDPDPRHRGRGLKWLRGRGVHVEVAPAEWGAGLLLEEFRLHLERTRPYVLLKWAAALDGSWSPLAGRGVRLSGAEALREVHRLRAHVDGVLVGSGTVLADDPLLTARPPGERALRRIVLDGRGRLPSSWRALEEPDPLSPVLWVTSSDMERPGAQRIRVRSCRDLRHEVLPELRELGVERLLVEGGPSVAAAFLQQRLVDRAWVFLTPGLHAQAEASETRLRLQGPLSAGRLEAIRRTGNDAWFRLVLAGT